ncbi:hypothetical protein GCM10029992_38040 [Glycomyces albus]
MERPEDPNPKRRLGHVSGRTIRIVEAVVAHPGRSTKSLLRLLADSGDDMSHQTLRNHLKVLIEAGWVVQDQFGQHRPGPSLPQKRATSDGSGSLLVLLLEELSQAPLGATPAQLAQRSGHPEERITQAILPAVDRGWITREEDGTYRLDLNALVSIGSMDAAMIEPALQRCANLLGSSVFLASFDTEDSVQVVAHGEAPGVLYIEDIIDGLANSAHSSALGRALTATLPQRERAAYFRERGLPPFTSATVRTFEELNGILTKASRDGGIFTEHGETIPDIHCTGMVARNGPMLSDRFAIAVAERPMAALLPPKTVADALRKCIAELAPILKPRALPSPENRSRRSMGDARLPLRVESYPVPMEDDVVGED